ncbi:MAG: hypothetical protein B7Z37_25210 [Verrucomicrobia bacterium 12-59-8]|nr:MAG: hypothetical protein B7Z37_25210 [Verrucomicrobia bacterium 12-59-8]
MKTKPKQGARAGVRRNVEWRVSRVLSIIASGKCPSCQEIADEIEGVSAKTIMRDIAHLQTTRNAPIEYDAVRHGYFLNGPLSDLPPIQLTRGELVALFVAQKALEPLRGTPLQKVVKESVNKIAAACPESVTMHWEDLDAAYSVKATGVLAADASLFARLLDAVMNKREVTFSYQKLDGKGRSEERRVQPYHVGQLQNGWYLIAHDLARKEMRKFALQRMSGLEVLKVRFKRDPSFNMREYLSSGFGVWSYVANTRRYEVRIRFTGWAARVVAERLWHPSQVITPLKEDDSEVEFRAELAGLEEITRWVLSHGRQARVIGPEELKQRVREEAALVLEAAERQE